MKEQIQAVLAEFFKDAIPALRHSHCWTDKEILDGLADPVAKLAQKLSEMVPTPTIPRKTK